MRLAYSQLYHECAHSCAQNLFIDVSQRHLLLCVRIVQRVTGGAAIKFPLYLAHCLAVSLIASEGQLLIESLS
jgi:hypothetical protein